MTKLIITVEGNKAQLSGPLNRDSIALLEPKAHTAFIKLEKATVDLTHVTVVDTAGLAWLLYLVECAQKTKCQLSFVQMPDDLLKLAKLSAVNSFFHRN